jgi:hypothetical protein
VKVTLFSTSIVVDVPVNVATKVAVSVAVVDDVTVSVVEVEVVTTVAVGVSSTVRDVLVVNVSVDVAVVDVTQLNIRWYAS